ncbi:MAG TPA: polysaccharide deacetylase family protein [Nitrososphaerales archaeon]|nr:polysaccharide deacetylase family protein [Nitrososphaerales archaeon]
MKLVYLGAIGTGLVIIFGIAMISPAFTRMQDNTAQQLKVLLTFSVINDSNVPDWCNDLSSVLNKYDVSATVFITGKVADQNPECVTTFSDNIDIGSQTYSYVDLPSVPNYTAQLEEVKKGKDSVDNAGNLDSKVFKAPYGSTDQNIYSLLSRSNILADFSYENQYNKYYIDKFIWFNVTSYEGNEYQPEFFHKLSATDTPVLINFDNSTPVESIDGFIADLKSNEIRFLNASEVTRIDLTVREGMQP